MEIFLIFILGTLFLFALVQGAIYAVNSWPRKTLAVHFDEPVNPREAELIVNAINRELS